jgi:hypothetical protein
MINPDIVEWSAFCLGAVGTVLWAIEYRHHGKAVEGWFWLLSSLLWIVFAIYYSHKGLAMRDLVGVCLCIFGLKKTLFEKGTLGKSAPAVGRVSHVSPAPAGPTCNDTGTHQLSGPGTTTCACQRIGSTYANLPS